MDYNYNGYDRGYTEPAMTSADYMNRTYRWMAVGLLITFAAAFVTAATPLLYVVNSLYLVFTIAELVLVYVLSSRVQNMSVGGARATFFAYALLNGMVLSYYFLIFDLGTLVLGSQADDGPVRAHHHRLCGHAVRHELPHHGAVQRCRSGGVHAADRL